MEVVSNEFRFAILRKWIYELQVPLYELQSNFTNCKFVLPVGNKIMSCKLFFASCELLFMSYKFREIVFRVASCVLWIENLKFHFKNLKFHFKSFTSWKDKTIMFTSCEVAEHLRCQLYKLSSHFWIKFQENKST